MIRGVGTDIVEIARIASTMAGTGEAFAQRILSEVERSDWERANRSNAFLAKRWAMKEAFGKACGTGLRDPLTWQNLWVVHDELGAPTIEVAPWVRKWLKERKITHWHVSVSDEKNYVVAVAITEERAVDE
jgi:holo-[acyl-carrier protein] synthase